jgi:hypothetical protein
MTRGACERNFALKDGEIVETKSIVYDGCQQFSPLSSSSKCAACGCHKNFHKEISSGSETSIKTQINAHVDVLQSTSHAMKTAKPKDNIKAHLEVLKLTMDNLQILLTKLSH